MRIKIVCTSYFTLGLVLESFQNKNDYSRESEMVRQAFAKVKDQHGNEIFVAIPRCFGGELTGIWKSLVREIKSNRDIAHNFTIEKVPDTFFGFTSISKMELAIKIYNDDCNSPHINTPLDYEKVDCFIFDENDTKKKGSLFVPTFPEKRGGVLEIEEAFWQYLKRTPILSGLYREGLEIC